MTRGTLPDRIRSTLATALLIVVAAWTACPAQAAPTGPTARQRRIALTVVELLRRDHLTKHALDDEIGRRCLEVFLDSLDPWKLYFYQADVDRFRARENQLDDLFRQGDIGFAYEVFRVFLQRVDERLAAIDQLLAAQHDFTLDEEMVKDRDSVSYARNEAEAYDRWRKRIKFDLLVQKADDVSMEEAVKKLSQRYHSFAKRMHQTDDDELLEMYLTAMTSSFDPHTTYMSPRRLENFEIIMRLELEGIGAALQSEDGYTVVKKIIPGGAADKDGRLKVEDRIVGVGQGAEGQIEDVVDMKLEDVVQRIRGKAGTVVRLEVLSGDARERKSIAITRAKIELKDSEARYKIFDLGNDTQGQPYKIGVIDLPSFYMDMDGARRGLPDFKSATRDVQRILERFNEEGVDAVVLDLRRNGGGSLREAIDLTSLFLEEGPVVQVKDSEGRIQPYYDLDGKMLWSGPLVVVISKFSASASEIFAGAVQDYQRGIIVGDRATHGKGTVQSLVDLGQQLIPFNPPQLGALKITMQQFYRPSGQSTQNRGVLADIELPSLTTHMDVAESDLDYALPYGKVPPMDFKRYPFVDATTIDLLRRNSQQRLSQSEDFQKDQQDIVRYLERKEEKTVTLNEQRFLAEAEKLNTDKEEKETLEQINEPEDSEIKRDYYLDEVLAITLDYLQQLTGRVSQARSL